MKKNALLILMVISALSCRNDFYTRDGGYDYTRIPFIKPYEALMLKGSERWQMNLYNSALNSSIINIKKINVEKNAIFLYSEDTNLDGVKVPRAWFIIIPNKHLEEGFYKEKDYLEFLKSVGLNNEPSLIDINKVSDYFGRHYPINWSDIK